MTNPPPSSNEPHSVTEVCAAIAADVDRLVTVMTASLQELARIWTTEVAPIVTAFVEAAARSGLTPKPLPTDPMARALELRRTRNTGPTNHHRAPRRIDPTRTRR